MRKRNFKTKAVSIFVMLSMLIVSIAPAVAQDDSLLIWVPSDLTLAMEVLAEEFEAEFGITLEIEEVSFGDQANDLLNFGPAGEGADIIVTENSRLGQLVDNGALYPMDLTGLEDLFEPSALEIFTYQNQLWAMPYAWENVAFVRNTDLVPEAPATWQEVRAISEELIASEQSQYGFMLQSGNAYHSFPILSAFGGYLFAPTDDGAYDVTDIGLNSEGGLAAAQWISDMYADELMVMGVDRDVMLELWGSSNIAMFITGPWDSQRLIDSGISYELTSIPGAEGAMENGSPFAGGFAFAISAFSEKQFLAETFLLDFMATQSAMESILIAEEGSVLFRFPAFLEVDYGDDPNIGGFIAAGQNSTAVPQIPEMGSVWGAWANALTLVGQGEDPTETFTVAVDQIATAIDIAATGPRLASVPGDFQDEIGCDADFDPACDLVDMEDLGDGIFALTVTLPAGDWQYKVALNDAWDESYPEGFDNLMLSLSEETEVTIVFDDNTKSIMNSVEDDVSAFVMSDMGGERTAGLPGSFQDEVGCDADWNPACEATMMEAQGDGIFTLTLTIPAGEWEYKVALNGAWDESYPDGLNNLMLSLSEETEVTFTYDDNTNMVSDSVNGG